jgi:tRNA A37 threonylcarbamoyladenosine biosynthesis protein TsaE
VEDYLLGRGEIEKGVVLIEWAERIRSLWPNERIEVRIAIRPRSTERVVSIKGTGAGPAHAIAAFKKDWS